MKTTGTLDAVGALSAAEGVADSRSGKEAVARGTGGRSDDLQRGQAPACFSKARALATPAEMRHRSGQASVVREETPGASVPCSGAASDSRRAGAARGKTGAHASSVSFPASLPESLAALRGSACFLSQHE